MTFDWLIVTFLVSTALQSLSVHFSFHHRFYFFIPKSTFLTLICFCSSPTSQSLSSLSVIENFLSKRPIPTDSSDTESPNWIRNINYYSESSNLFSLFSPGEGRTSVLHMLTIWHDPLGGVEVYREMMHVCLQDWTGVPLPQKENDL